MKLVKLLICSMLVTANASEIDENNCVVAEKKHTVGIQVAEKIIQEQKFSEVMNSKFFRSTEHNEYCSFWFKVEAKPNSKTSYAIEDAYVHLYKKDWAYKGVVTGGDYLHPWN